MNFSKKNHQVVDQNDKKVRKSQKHEVNVQKNSTLYFQVGLALTLLVTYSLFEMRFQVSQVVIDTVDPIEPDDVFVLNKFTIEKEPVKQKQKAPAKKVLLTKDPIIVNNDVAVKSALDNVITELPTVGTDAPVKVEDVAPVIDIVEAIPLPAVQFVPIYPGCEKYTTNLERKKCMSSKINKLISRKLNPDKLASAGVLGRQTVFVEFTIDKLGEVTDIKTMTRAKSHADDLKKEALRVTKKIPQMKPGRQSDKVVPVRFTLPITVDIKD